MLKSQSFINIIADILYIGILYFIYTFTPYYADFLNSSTHYLIAILAITFILGSIFYNLFFSIISESKTLIFFKLILKKSTEVKHIFKNLKAVFALNKYEQTLILSFLVKAFYIPLMLNFTVVNFYNFRNLVLGFPLYINNFIVFFNQNAYFLILTGIFLLDTLIFTFGYLFESKLLKNEIKSVEPTIFGWVVTLICYPPFNSFTDGLITWTARENAFFFNETSTFIIRIVIVFLLLIYISATFSLGFKSSNLTNRGIVTNGPYAIVRHPAYMSKNLIWWLLSIPLLTSNPFLISGPIVWTIIYALRAITEENHLKQDIDYVEYCQRVKYRFIPYLF